jgi:hypothetical protein
MANERPMANDRLIYYYRLYVEKVKSSITGRFNPSKFVNDAWYIGEMFIPKCPDVISIRAREGLQIGRAIGSTRFNYVQLLIHACRTKKELVQRSTSLTTFLVLRSYVTMFINAHLVSTYPPVITHGWKIHEIPAIEDVPIRNFQTGDVQRQQHPGRSID